MYLFTHTPATGTMGAFTRKILGARTLAVELVPSFVELVQQIAPRLHRSDLRQLPDRAERPGLRPPAPLTMPATVGS